MKGTAKAFGVLLYASAAALKGSCKAGKAGWNAGHLTGIPILPVLDQGQGS